VRLVAKKEGSARRALLVVLVIAIAVLAARIAAPSRASHFRFSAALACGVERWQVKTLQDRPHLIPAQATTFAHLVGLPRPSPLPTTRSLFERHIFSVVARVTLARSEADQDLHLVVTRGAKHMIAEAPDAPTCTVKATRLRRRQMAATRSNLRLCSKARVVGRLLGFQARPDGCRSERDRAAPDPRLRLLVGLTLAPASAGGKIPQQLKFRGRDVLEHAGGGS
jgi:hypothetical protein